MINRNTICIVCKKQFILCRAHKKFCSVECEVAAEMCGHDESLYEFYINSKKQSKECLVCGVDFVSTHGNRVYCSIKCRERAIRISEDIKGSKLSAKMPRHCIDCKRELPKSGPFSRKRCVKCAKERRLTIYPARDKSLKKKYGEKIELYREELRKQREEEIKKNRYCADCGGPIEYERGLPARFCIMCVTRHRFNYAKRKKMRKQRIALMANKAKEAV